MKCPMCSGKGMVDYPMYADDEHKWQYCVARMKKCDMCNGTGEVQMTNEEWLRTATTEQLAEEVYKLVWCSNELFQQMECSGIDTKENDLKIVMRWLKQPHTPKE